MSIPSRAQSLSQTTSDHELPPERAGGHSPDLEVTRRIILTISIVPPGAPYVEYYDYKDDLLFLVDAFRRDTNTPLAAIFLLDEVGGIVSLLLPASQQHLTEAQRRWQFRYTEITGYDSALYRDTELAALFQREANA